MGTLFVLAGHLKIEAKSYLHTLKKANDNFHQVCQLVDSENPIDQAGEQFIRELKEDEKEYFEKDFSGDITRFILAISSGVKGVMTNSNMDLMLSLTNESFYDEMKELEDSDPKNLDLVLTSHFVTKFLVDVLQFSFAFFVRASNAGSEPDKKSFYDHRKKVDLDRDCKETALLNLEFVVANFEQIVMVSVESLNSIWTSPFNLVKFWCIKYAENPDKARECDVNKDAYDRQDNYDAQGISVWAYLNLKEHIDHLCGRTESIMKNQSMVGFMKFSFVFEVCMPSINFLIQKSISHANSETLKQIGIEMTTFLLFMSEQEGNQIYEVIGHFTKDDDSVFIMLSNLFAVMGERNQNYLKP